MSHLTLASGPADAVAAERVQQHHAEMTGTLDQLVRDVVAGTGTGSAATARRRLAGWAREELLPHAAAEETTLYAAATKVRETRLLVEAMLAEHRAIGGLVAELEQAVDDVHAAGAARALSALFAVHLAKEEEQLLPALVGSGEHSVAAMLEGMHEILGAAGEAQPQGESGGDHACGCGEAEPAGHPELDARAVPHAIRHATIFGALDAVPPGGGLVLVAPHDPVPLLAQVEQRHPGRFEVSYLERGPQAWRLRFVRA